MWQKGSGIFCHGVEGEEEKEEDDSDLDPDYKDDYDYGNVWDREELLLDKEDEEEMEDKADNIDGYTVSERAYLNRIDNFKAAPNDKDDNNNDTDEVGGNNNIENDDEGEEEEKDEIYYLREERALKHVEIISN